MEEAQTCIDLANRLRIPLAEAIAKIAERTGSNPDTIMAICEDIIMERICVKS